ncbi:MAG TPA: hypothetical protein VNX67_06730 [Solirubrobacteraceae bacterium]|nr:hypothetical protein [Solirubrobacteraceae bacterium]
MLGPSRPLPRVGAPARITHFGGTSESGVVAAIHNGGRRLRVCILTGTGGSEGESYEFVLNPASARFVSAGGAYGPRLELGDLS